MKIKGYLAIVSTSMLIGACGGGGGGSPAASTGVFVDSVVAGIGYRTATQSGVTSANGEYSYLPGETVTFFIGNIQFPPVAAKGTVTPLDIAQTTDVNNQIVSNIAVLLQSLDEDGDPTNGIKIPASAGTKATSAVNFDVSPLAFSANTTVINLVANSGSVTKTLVPAATAIGNFQATLTGMSLPYTASPVAKQAASIVTPEPASTNCAQGGSKIESGIDTNGNNILDPEEVTNTSYVCNGATGAPGAAGTNAMTRVSTESAGANCASGGSRIEVGIDKNANGALDSSEVTDTSYVCNGANGASGYDSLVKVTEESIGLNCLTGGNKIQVGLDLNRNGVLDASEVTSTQYTCNGIFPSNFDITPPVITSTAPQVATSFNTTYTMTASDDVELAFVQKSVNPALIPHPVALAENTKTYQWTESQSIDLGKSYKGTVLATDTSGNIAKKTITIGTPDTGIKLGYYTPTSNTILPTGFDCTAASGYPFSFQSRDGASITTSTIGDSAIGSIAGDLIYRGWSASDGYRPTISMAFGDAASTTLIPLNASMFAFDSTQTGGSTGIIGTSGPSSIYVSLVTGYFGTISVSQNDPTAVNVVVQMKCNMNNSGFINGVPASFTIQYVTTPVISIPESTSALVGIELQLYGNVLVNTSSSITYAWTFTSKPVGSQAILNNSTSAAPTFTPDVAGTYVAQLTVNDGTHQSASATITITAVNPSGSSGATTSPDTTAPFQPFNVVAKFIDTLMHQVTLSWSPPWDDVGVTQYNVYHGTTLLGSTSTRSFIDTNYTAINPDLTQGSTACISCHSTTTAVAHMDSMGGATIPSGCSSCHGAGSFIGDINPIHNGYTLTACDAAGNCSIKSNAVLPMQ